RVGLGRRAEGGELGGIGAEPIADGRGARAKGEEASGAGDQLTVAGGVIELPVGDLALEYDIADAESDEVAVARGVRHVPRGEEDGGGVGASHGAQVGGAGGRQEGPGRARAVVVGWAEEEVAPFRILMPVVPRHVLVYHGPRRGMHGDVLDQPLADHPDAAAVAERLAILAARSHLRLSYPNDPWHACRRAF